MNSTTHPLDPIRDMDWVRALARRLLRDAHLADDVAQDAWLAVARQGEEGAPSRSWLRAAVRNLAHLRLRREARRRAREKVRAARAAAAGAESAQQLLLRVEAQRRVAEAVTRLPAPQREVVLLRYTEGLAPAAIARRLSLPAGTVRSRLARALATLRGQLAAADADDDRSWLPAVVALAQPPASGSLAGGGVLLLAGWKLGLGAALAAAVAGTLWGLGAGGRELPPVPGPGVVAVARGEGRQVEPGVDSGLRAVSTAHRVTGRVVCPPGVPPSSITVALLPAENESAAGAPLATAQCDAAGGYALSLAAPAEVSTAMVVAWAGTERQGAGAVLPRPGRVAVHGGSVARDLVLERGEEIRGHALQYDGTAAAPAAVHARLVGAKPVRGLAGLALWRGRYEYAEVHAEVDGRGAFALGGLATADYDVSWRGRGYAHYLSEKVYPRRQRVAAPAARVELRFGFRLVDVLVHAGGVPLSGARVTTRWASGGGATFRTGERGVVSYALRAGGELAVWVEADGYRARRVVLRESELPHGTPVGIELQAGLAPGTVVFHLLGDETVPVEYAVLELEPRPGDEGAKAPRPWQQRVARSGDGFRFERVPAGPFRARLSPSGPSGEAREHSYALPWRFDLDVAAGGHTERRLRVVEGGRFEIPRALCADGEPSLFELRDAAGEFVHLQLCGERHLDGSVYVMRDVVLYPDVTWGTDRALPAGRYRLALWTAGAPRRMFDLRVDAGRTVRVGVSAARQR